MWMGNIKYSKQFIIIRYVPTIYEMDFIVRYYNVLFCSFFSPHFDFCVMNKFKTN